MIHIRPTHPRLLIEPVQQYLRVLAKLASPHAERRPDKPVPPDVRTEVEAIFATVRTLLARQPGRRRFLEPTATMSWAALSLRVSLAWHSVYELQEFFDFCDDVGRDVRRPGEDDEDGEDAQDDEHDDDPDLASTSSRLLKLANQLGQV